MKIKICPQCKTENRGEANFCKECRLDLTRVLTERVRKEPLPLRKIALVVIGACIVVFAGWYVITGLTAGKSRKAVREMIRIEKEVNSIDNEMARRYSADEIDKAREFLKKAEKAKDRNDHAGAVEWLVQSREMLKTAGEKEKTGRESNYSVCMENGKSNAEKGDWDGALEQYQEALKYKPGDGKTENEINFVEKQKEEYLRRQDEAREEQQKREATEAAEAARKQKEEDLRKQEEARKREEQRKQEEARRKEEQKKQNIADCISKGKRYLEQKKYLQAVDEFQKAVELGATGEVTELLAEAKKKKKMYEVQKGKWRIIDDDIVIVGTGGDKYLMWPRKKDSAGCNNGESLSWQEAMSWADNLVYKGYDDWRLPTKDELKQLYDYGKTYITYSGYYWSSTSVYDTGGAWAVRFLDGYVGYGDRAYNCYVRPLRGSP